MPRKKRVKRSVKRARPKRVRRARPSRVSRRRVKRAARKPARRRISNIKRRINLALKNLILFSILFILTIVLYSVSSNPLLVTFFGVLSIIFAFVAVAFLIALLVFFFLRS